MSHHFFTSLGLLVTVSLASTLAASTTPAPGPDSGMLPVADGPFKPDWASLHQYQTPDWFRDAKFGIWAHWTAQCVPEQGDWYARNMYIQYNKDPKTGQLSKTPGRDWLYHIDHYGPQSQVGFKDIDNLWHAENWNPDKLIDLYKRAGAKYFVALANHHDNFDCFDSKYQPWNSVNIGPKQDIVGKWAAAARKAGLRFGVTVHAARTWTWFDVSHGADIDGKYAGIPYDGNLTKADGKGKWWEGYDPVDLYGPAGAARTPEARLAYNVKFYNRTLDLIGKYKPDLLYFDDSVMPLNGEPGDYGLKIAADYYNSSIQWHGKNEGVMNTKNLDMDQRQCLVRDIERGKNETIDPNPWQTDTCIGSWHYQRSIFEHHGYKKPGDIICMLIDIVSKNGNLLLNIPVRGDGTIDSDEQACLESIASWMSVNTEGIFGTRPWKIYGEGPSTTLASGDKGTFGGLKDVSTKPYTTEDFRFTSKGNILYAFSMALPQGDARIKSLGNQSPQTVKVTNVELVGSPAKLKWTQQDDALVISCPAKLPSQFVSTFKITTQS
jgi:alpha-L-fucosidase